MRNARVLDIDLDFFLDWTSRPTKTVNRKENIHITWEAEDVQQFLEKNCGLCLTKKPKGKVFTHHHEVYKFCKDLRSKDERIMFEIDHVDSHADLGIMDSSVVSIFTDEKIVMGGSWVEASDEKKYNLNPGNFLIFFLLQGWMSKLTYIAHPSIHSDINTILLSDRKNYSSPLTVKYYPTLDDIANDENGVASSRSGNVLFKEIDYRLFNNCRSYDFVLLTISPDYMPTSADSLVPLISNYFVSC